MGQTVWYERQPVKLSGKKTGDDSNKFDFKLCLLSSLFVFRTNCF
jgi:hypothetical protein